MQDDGKLSLTLTKRDRGKLWEQLGRPAELVRDSEGKVDASSSHNMAALQPLTAEDRIAMFREMVEGDDGQDPRYEELDPDARQLVDALRLHRHARATGDEQKLARAEAELDELGRMVI